MVTKKGNIQKYPNAPASGRSGKIYGHKGGISSSEAGLLRRYLILVPMALIAETSVGGRTDQGLRSKELFKLGSTFKITNITSPTVNPALSRSPLNHIPKWHFYTSFKSPQGW